MDTTSVLQKLIEIEQAVGREELATIRRMVMEAQECVLGVPKCALARPSSSLQTTRYPFPN